MTNSDWRQYSGYFRKVQRPLAAASAVSVLQAGVLIPVPLLIRVAFDEAIPEGRDGLLVTIGLALVAVQIVSGLVTLGARHIILVHSRSAIADLRYDAVRKLLEMNTLTFRRADLAELHDRVVTESQRVSRMTLALLGQVLPSGALLFGIAVVLAFLNLSLFLVTALFLPVAVLVNRLLRTRVRTAVRDNHRDFEEFSDGALFLLRFMDEVKVRGNEEDALEDQRRRIDAVADSGRLSAWWRLAYQVTQQGVVALVFTVVLIVGGLAVVRESISLGEFLSFYAGLALLRTPVASLGSALPVIIEGRQSLRSLLGLVNMTDTQPYHGSRHIDFSGSVRLIDVEFAYDEQPVLSGLSLELEPGTVTALMGANGAGKTTLLNIILGLYRPQRGEVHAHGVPYEMLDLAKLRRRFGVVPQIPAILPGTIRDNIVYGSPRLEPDHVAQAAKLAVADEFIEELALGYDTEMAAIGGFLSGGQHQRVALARALIGRPRLLLLDEPTAHLDPPVMQEVMRRLTTLDFAPAILIVSHDRAVQEFADRTLRLVDGRIEPGGGL